MAAHECQWHTAVIIKEVGMSKFDDLGVIHEVNPFGQACPTLSINKQLNCNRYRLARIFGSPTSASTDVRFSGRYRSPPNELVMGAHRHVDLEAVSHAAVCHCSRLPTCKIFRGGKTLTIAYAAGGVAATRRVRLLGSEFPDHFGANPAVSENLEQ